MVVVAMSQIIPDPRFKSALSSSAWRQSQTPDATEAPPQVPGPRSQILGPAQLLLGADVDGDHFGDGSSLYEFVTILDAIDRYIAHTSTLEGGKFFPSGAHYAIASQAQEVSY